MIANIILLAWFFLDMIGVYFGEKYLVTRSYKEDGIFFIMMLVAFLLFIFKEKIGRIVLIVWLTLWFVVEFLMHEWYTIFGSGIMGSIEGKMHFFKDAIYLIKLESRYVPDLYHIILHILILGALVTTALYCRKSSINIRN